MRSPSTTWRHERHRPRLLHQQRALPRGFADILPRASQPNACDGGDRPVRGTRSIGPFLEDQRCLPGPAPQDPRRSSAARSPSASTRSFSWVPRATSTRSEPALGGRASPPAGWRLVVSSPRARTSARALERLDADLGIIGQVQPLKKDVADDRFVLEPEELAQLVRW